MLENKESETITKFDLVSDIPARVKNHLQLQNSGHIVSFISNVNIGINSKSKKSVCFKMEFPEKDLFSVNCFARLFTTNMAHIVKNLTNIPMTVEGLDIIATNEHNHFNIVQKDGIINITKIFRDRDVGCILICLYLDSGEFQGVHPRAFSLKNFLPEEKIFELTKQVEESYYYLTKEIARDCWKGDNND